MKDSLAQQVGQIMGIPGMETRMPILIVTVFALIILIGLLYYRMKEVDKKSGIE